MMENQNEQENNSNMSSGNKGGGGNYNMCGSRQSSTRWTPTTDQIRILKELYYNNGVRSPSAEQIQRISARLRQYGKIEGKNVFYWFQNHKARERQKKRFISDITPPNHHLHSFQRSPAAHNSSAPPPASAAFHHTNNFNITTTTNIITPHGVVNACAPSSSTASPGVFAGVGPYGGGSVTMEKSFRDCSLSAGGSNLGWAAVDPYALYNNNNHEIRRNVMMSLEEEHEHDHEHEDVDEDDDEVPEIETLPLFPLHNEDINNGCFFNMKPPSSHDGYYSTGWYRPDHDGYGRSRASLELTLSYNGRSHE